MSDRGAEDAVRRFQREMRKLRLGVTIQVGDDEPVVICEAPEESSGTTTNAERSSPESGSAPGAGLVGRGHP